MQRRRAIDRILDEGYLDDLRWLDTQQLRARRDECQEHEAGVSYARRVIQGKLDILQAEAARRSKGDGPDSVLHSLADVLADRGTRPAVSGRAPQALVPPEVPHHRRWLDQVVDDDTLAELARRSDEVLSELADDMLAREKVVSTMRRELLDRIDAIQAALAGRYRDEGVDLAGILARGT